MKLVIIQAPSETDDLDKRIERLSQPITKMTATECSVQFLRGIHSRATFISTAFHEFVAASSELGSPSVPGHAGIVFRHYLKHTAFASLTLDCRKAFDEKNSGLRGGFFARVSDQVLGEHADFWADRANVSRDDALAALTFLRQLFATLSRSRSDLIKGKSGLEKRIGLIKFHADRSAAHLSLEDYAVHILDLSHMVAAFVFIGEIIRPFDDPWGNAAPFNELDADAVVAAKALFPGADSLPMFAHMELTPHAVACWKNPSWGLDYVLNGLPGATGWF